jgi:hypothetical protein
VDFSQAFWFYFTAFYSVQFYYGHPPAEPLFVRISGFFRQLNQAKPASCAALIDEAALQSKLAFGGHLVDSSRASLRQKAVLLLNEKELAIYR